MKKIIQIYSLVVSLFFVSCVSLWRGPASDKTISFNLYGENSVSDKKIKYYLLDIGELKKSKIDFDGFLLNETTLVQINNWLNELSAFQSQMTEKEFKFTDSKISIAIKRKEIDQLIQVINAVSDVRQKLELITAFNNKFRNPLENDIELLAIPFILIDRLSNYDVDQNKSEELKVAASSFWSPRSEINSSGQLQVENCRYRGPKTGYGTHPGFKMTCDGKKLKVKFGEVHSAPLNSQLYHRLGYNVPVIHYAEKLTIDYDRKIFDEINSSKKQFVRLDLAGIEVAAINASKSDHNILHKVVAAQLVDGSTISKADFLKMQSDPQLELQIARVTFGPVALVEQEDEFEIGSWGFDELDHSTRPEVKALVLVGAWTGNYDLRKDNTELVLKESTGEIKHVISDPGSGLVNQAKLYSRGKINEMQWEVVKEAMVQVSHPKSGGTQQRKVIQIHGYRASADHDAFENLNLAEARWMASNICQVSEEEITRALHNAGLSAAELLLVREKLVSIQKNMAHVFKLENIPDSLKQRTINRKLNYLAGQDQVMVRNRNGENVQVIDRGFNLVNGKLQRIQ